MKLWRRNCIPRIGSCCLLICQISGRKLDRWGHALQKMGLVDPETINSKIHTSIGDFWIIIDFVFEPHQLGIYERNLSIITNKAYQVRWSSEGMCFPRSSLTVTENGGRIAFHRHFDNSRNTRFIHDVTLSSCLIENGIERERFGRQRLIETRLRSRQGTLPIGLYIRP